MKKNNQLKNSENNIKDFLSYLSLDKQDNVLVWNNIQKYDYTTIKGLHYRGIKFLKNNNEKILLFNVDKMDKKNLKLIKKLRLIMDTMIILFEKNFSLKEVEEYLNLNDKQLYGYVNYDNVNLRQVGVITGRIYDSFNKKVKLKKVLAVIHTYNEEDCIERTIKHLINEGIDVKIYDNWSTDKTWEIILKLNKKYPSKVFIDKFPNNKPKDNSFDLFGCLNNVEKTVKEMDYDWFIHYDADEIRVSPINNLTLQEYISYVDMLGYNAISNTVLDFRLVKETKKDDIFSKNTYFEFGRRPGHFLQIKTFKKIENIDIANSGGHNCYFEGQKVFPIKIILKHYPMRNIEQARKKVFIDRLPRFEKEKKTRGWHAQYDNIVSDKDLIYNKNKLFKYSKDIKKKYFLELLTGVGINKIEK